MAKEIQITLDDKSIEILKNIDEIHRASVINVGLALVSRTGYYSTLCNKNESLSLDDIASLDVKDESGKIVTVNKKEVQKEKKSTSWDSF
jgi:hypothetical protein